MSTLDKQFQNQRDNPIHTILEHTIPLLIQLNSPVPFKNTEKTIPPHWQNGELNGKRNGDSQSVL